MPLIQVARVRIVTVACVLGVVLSGCGGSSPSDTPTAPTAPSPSGSDAATTARCTQQFGDPSASPYRLPFESGRTYTLFQGYCPPNPSWGHHGWLAYDFDLAIGDTVIASRDGRVSFVEERWPDSDRVCGHENSVWVVHADGTVMSYVHLTTDGALVQVGDQVTAGQPIGTSGDSGCSSGPHLHVALFRDGSSFNKENTLPLNYWNAVGPVDERGGLVQGASYTAQ